MGLSVSMGLKYSADNLSACDCSGHRTMEGVFGNAAAYNILLTTIAILLPTPRPERRVNKGVYRVEYKGVKGRQSSISIGWE